MGPVSGGKLKSWVGGRRRLSRRWEKRLLYPSWCHRQAGGGRAVFAKGADDISEIPAIRKLREGLR